MSNYFKPISISLSPNVEKDDLKVALNLAIRPWLWKNGKTIKELEESFRNYLGVKYAYSFNSGRSAFYAILKALELPKKSEVALQAFTCNAVPNPVIWADLEPLYIDCNTNDYNLSVSDLGAKLTPNTRAVVIQHTFGLPAGIEQISAFCKAKNLILIEDCAHSLGAEYNGQKVGTFGKVAFFSFSRDKVISSVYGGMAVTNDPEIAKKLENLQKEFGQPPDFWTFQQILHPILLNYIILPIYNFLDLGKMLLVASQVLHILSKAVSWQEKQGKRPDYFPKALPNAMSAMAMNQLAKVEKFNQHRQKVAEYYYKELEDKFSAQGGPASGWELPEKFQERKNIFLRFTVQNKNAHEIIYNAWHKQNILMGDWYTTPIAPFDTNVKEIKYIAGTCPNAEYLAKRTLNLPTHINISQKDAERIVNFLKNFK
jgi:dTDP-4-amino-4,6-dideoxygalactose transaminase